MTEIRKRVKVYALNLERQWEDKGTGFVSTSNLKQLKDISLTVMSEIDGTILLQVRIQPHVPYQKQQDTLIVWSEDKNIDLALSFQEKSCCDEVWKTICEFQGKDSSVDVTQEIIEDSEEDERNSSVESAPEIDLPLCELYSLKEINEIINRNMHSPVRREKMALVIEYEGYIEKLLCVFHECEDAEYTEGLHYLYEIFHNLFLLNKYELFEEMLKEDNIMNVIGCLEYDPKSPLPRIYRKELNELSHFKEVIPIKDRELITKIHQTYRIQYIHDLILPITPITENNMFSTLSSILLMNRIDIVTSIQNDGIILCKLFAMLNNEITDNLKRRDLILFLKELFTLAQCLQTTERENFSKRLASLGIFQTFETNIRIEDTCLKTALTNILCCFVEFSPSTVREYITSSRDHSFMNAVTYQIMNDLDPELGGACQIFCILKILLDTENMLLSGSQSEKCDFLNYFYNNTANVLIAPILNNAISNKTPVFEFGNQQLFGLILDLLAFCVDKHTHYIQNYIIKNDLLKPILFLLKSKYIFVALEALKCMRKIIGQLDETYDEYVIKGNHFAPIIESIIESRRDNILNSAILEMFHFINLESSLSMCHHIINNFWNMLKDINYTSVFKNLKLRSDSHKDGLKDPESESNYCVRDNRYRRDERDLEEDEEKWFDEGDLEDEISCTKQTDDIFNETFLHNNLSVKKGKNNKSEILENISTKSNEVTISNPAVSGNQPLPDGISVSCKRALVDYDGDSDEEDEVLSPPLKRAKYS